MLDIHFSKQVTLKDGTVLTLRFPTPDDTQVILDLVNELVEEDTYFLLTEKMTFEQEKEFLVPVFKAMEEGKSFTLEAFDEDRIVGWISFNEISPRSLHARELGIAIKKEYRGKGLGNILMEEGLQLCKTGLHCTMCMLTVGEENEPGVQLYKKFGFVEAGNVPNLVKFKGKLMGQRTYYKEFDK